LLARPVRAPSAEAAAREEIWECSDGSSLLRIALLLLALIADTSGRAHPRETAFPCFSSAAASCSVARPSSLLSSRRSALAKS